MNYKYNDFINFQLQLIGIKSVMGRTFLELLFRENKVLRFAIRNPDFIKKPSLKDSVFKK
jgi:hypothetical protein